MDDTIIIRIDDGVFAGSESTNPTIHRVAIISNGHTKRIATVRRLVTEDEIAEAVHAINDCKRMDAWKTLDDARELVVETLLRSARASIGLAERLQVPMAEHVPDLAKLLADLDELAPAMDEAERRHSDALTALRGFKDLRHRAAAVLGADAGCAEAELRLGHEQQSQITVEHRRNGHV